MPKTAGPLSPIVPRTDSSILRGSRDGIFNKAVPFAANRDDDGDRVVVEGGSAATYGLIKFFESGTQRVPYVVSMNNLSTPII